MKLGIIGAMQMEVETLLHRLEDAKQTQRCGTAFNEGRLEGLDVVIVQCGVGKVNAAIITQLLVDCFGVTHLVNTGAAGSLSNDLNICDFLVSQDAMHHDVDATIFGYPYGKVPGMDTVAFPADEALMAQLFAAVERVYPGHTKIGRVASGDQFISDREVKQQILANTQAMCTEMEGAAIAQTAYRNSVPYAILRCISDKADGSDFMDYPAFEELAAHRSAEIMLTLAAMLAEE